MQIKFSKMSTHTSKLVTSVILKLHVNLLSEQSDYLTVSCEVTYESFYLHELVA